MVHVQTRCMQRVPHWAFWSSIYWGNSSRQEPQQMSGPLWSTAWWGSTQGSSRVTQETLGEAPGPLSCGTFKLLHILRSTSLSPPMTLTSNPILPSWLGRYQPFPGVIWDWGPTSWSQLYKLVDPWLLVCLHQLSALPELIVLSTWL